MFVLLVPGNKKRKETMEKLKKGKELYLLITFFIGLIWAVFGFYQKYLDNNEEILNTLKTTQQMAVQ